MLFIRSREARNILARGTCRHKGCLDHEAIDLPPEWQTAIAELEMMLLPENIEEQFRPTVSETGWRHIKDEGRPLHRHQHASS